MCAPQGLLPAWLSCGSSNIPLLLQAGAISRLLKTNQRRPSWPGFFTAVPSHCPLYPGTARSAGRPPSSGLLCCSQLAATLGRKVSVPLRLCVDMSSHLWVHIHLVFVRKPANYSKGTWCLRVLGLHSSSCMHLTHLVTLNI